MNFVEYPDRELMFFDLADQLASELSAALRQKDRVSFCVPGGTTPGPVFDVLSDLRLEWERVVVFLNDERWVPESSPRSNTRLLRERLLKGRAAAATLVPLYVEADEPEWRLSELSEGIEPYLPIDVLLLGMGTDMHTASLFPGADRLKEALHPEAPILVPMRAETAGEARITLSARVLSDAMACHILILGPEKRAALQRAQRLPPEEAPVRAVLANATVHWAE
ncbi:6-phosphogluconolactonase [Ostreiculturibacter nitratireducens]|uniref:6-phosphogluconolactonase n=1 Tax=Ostreiculturibacter nitratireducens TaxID=3075226 RepID=UPI0031B5B00A